MSRSPLSGSNLRRQAAGSWERPSRRFSWSGRHGAPVGDGRATLGDAILFLLELIVQFLTEAFESNSWGKALFRVVVVPLLIGGVALSIYLVLSN